MYLKREAPPLANSLITCSFQSFDDFIMARWMKYPLSLVANAIFILISDGVASCVKGFTLV